MKQFIYHYIDHLTLAIALVIIFVLSFKSWKKSGKLLRLGILPLVFLGPVLLLTCMSTHLFEITYHAFESHFTGKSSLRFHLYTLYLMPIILGNAGFYFLRGTQAFLFSPEPRRITIIKPFVLVALILLPLLWLTPLSFVMFAVCGISIGASFLVHKQRQNEMDTEMFSLSEAASV